MTAPSGAKGALSVALSDRAAPGSDGPYPNWASSRTRSWPTAFAYGSNSSFGGVKLIPRPGGWAPRAPQCVPLPGDHASDVAMPYVSGSAGQRQPVGPPASVVEQAQLDALASLGEHGHIHGPPIPGRAHRVRRPLPEHHRDATSRI